VIKLTEKQHYTDIVSYSIKIMKCAIMYVGNSML